MKKIILSAVLVGVMTLAFGQKKAVRQAERGFKSGNLEEALTAIDAASADSDTGEDPATYLLKAKIQTKMFGSDSSNTMQTLEVGNGALETFNKAFEMTGQDKESKVGEEVYAQDIAGTPDNLRPYSVYTLKNIAFDKAIERYNGEDTEMAYEFFSLAGKIDRSDTTIHYNAGFLANELGKYEEAKEHFGYLLEVPDYNKLNAYYFLVQILSGEDKDPEAAYELISKAKKEYPNDKVLSEYEIQLLLQLNKMDEAMSQIKEALANDPENVNLLLRSGYLKEQAGNIEEALVDYKKTVEISPDYYDGNYYTGALLLEEATNMLNGLNSLSDAEWEKQSPIIGKKADTNYKEAVKYFSKALELKPDNTEIMIILYQIHTRLKNTQGAEEMNKKLTDKLGANWQENM